MLSEGVVVVVWYSVWQEICIQGKGVPGCVCVCETVYGLCVVLR